MQHRHRPTGNPSPAPYKEGMSKPTIVWFRHDLRLADNPAVHATVERGGPVVPVFVWAPHEEGDWPPGAASRWWLHHSLASLAKDLDDVGSRLILRAGDSLDELRKIAEETGAEAVVWNRRYEPAVIERDKGIKESLKEDGLDVESFGGSLLFEPWEVETKEGKPYQVFSAFWRACKAKDEPSEPPPAPEKLQHPWKWPEGDELESFDLLPKIAWDGGFHDEWTPGTAGAAKRLERFLHEAVHAYKEDRNRPDLPGSSKLSPHLHFGEIGPRTVFHDTLGRIEDGRFRDAKKDGDVFLSEIGWREFAYHLLYHFPLTTDQPLREKFADFPWESDAKALKKWQRGHTGFPIVDAGMRELWTTGWMHNRVRMIVASFLTKDLRLRWQDGAKWFWDTLVDADLASNTLGWQWTAGCGADAAPYFRVFNPMLQGKKFDPNGEYTRHWVPELDGVDDRDLQQPWEADDPPADYPEPLVDHAEARDAALAAFEKIKGG